MSSCVAYVMDYKLAKECSRIPNLKDRVLENIMKADLVDNLIKAYGLCKYMKISAAEPASYDDLTSFHSSCYIDFLREVNESDDLENVEEEEADFGLGYDCPIFENIYNFASWIGGGSLTAANILINEEAKIAINWCGGWHHAQRDEARGFCYINDIVIAIQKLREKFDKVLYIDLDIHHGDGVENAFSFSRKVMTVSLHKYEVGFYPCTGSLCDVGFGNGKYFSVNVPLQDGITDDRYFCLFERVLSLVMNAFAADAVVVQCGADSISGDPIGTFNLTPKGMGKCVERILSYKLPTLFLGGGGYNITNTAKCWTYLTSVILRKKLPTDIPDHLYFTRYGPDFDLEIDAGLRRDLNTIPEIENIIKVIAQNLSNLI
ncbi:hypothetical protein J437_LFUL003040 [Ladona fulva]|uniref:Histone deacetylase n=1 Tax=Ladona fulva TaxID=123851 RepID=A0A8K0JVR7_LADFU|nr:hypothetical protein J437_LFUL003040 [Ladona fulva]